MQSSRKSRSDQVLVGIAINTILPEDLDYKIFSYTLSDYSDILQVPKPTVVASVFYGVKRRVDRDGERRRVKE